tara:strand:+ start:3336 stop:3530 length:195 start_codon:yes stop_codon:yes gene_type:complete
MFNVTELTVLRQGLETVHIKGSEARLMVSLQDKVEKHIIKLQQGPPQQASKEETKPTRGRKSSK